MSEKTSLIKGVRFEQESLSVYEQILLSVLVKNPCPFSAGIAVRFGQELVSVLVKNMHYAPKTTETLINYTACWRFVGCYYIIFSIIFLLFFYRPLFQSLYTFYQNRIFQRLQFSIIHCILSIPLLCPFYILRIYILLLTPILQE